MSSASCRRSITGFCRGLIVIRSSEVGDDISDKVLNVVAWNGGAHLTSGSRHEAMVRHGRERQGHVVAFGNAATDVLRPADAMACGGGINGRQVGRRKPGFDFGEGHVVTLGL